MKQSTIKEIIKKRSQAMTDADLRQYHKDHHYYNGKLMTKKYQPREKAVDPEIEKDKDGLSCLNTLLYPAPTLGSVMGNVLSSLKTEKTSRKTTPNIEKPSTDLLNRIKQYYEEYCQKGLAPLMQKSLQRLSPENIEVIKHAYANKDDATMVVQNICMLSEFWIRNPTRWDKKQSKSLLEYLFVEYEATAFLKAYWSKPADKSNLQWIMVYLAYAQGASLKLLSQYFDWKVESQKLWHQLPSSPTQYSALKAVIYTEIKRLGADNDAFEFIIENPAYNIDLLQDENENTIVFWYEMVRWLAQHADQLVGTEKSRILVWARHEFTEYTKQGQTFSMNGRSHAKVLLNTRNYHRSVWEHQAELARQRERIRLAGIEAQEAHFLHIEERELSINEQRAIQAHRDAGEYWEGTEISHLLTWSSYGWSWKADVQGYKSWSFTELTSAMELLEEGNAMDHCVAGYAYNCYEKEAAIISLRYNGKRCITIEIDPSTKTLIQASGSCNRGLKTEESEVINLWLKKVVGRVKRKRFH